MGNIINRTYWGHLDCAIRQPIEDFPTLTVRPHVTEIMNADIPREPFSAECLSKPAGNVMLFQNQHFVPDFC